MGEYIAWEAHKRRDTPPPSLKFWCVLKENMGFPGGARGKEPICQFKRQKKFGFDPCFRRCPVEGHGNPLQYSCLEKLMDIGTWLVTIHRATKSQTWLKWLSTALTAQWNAHIYLSLYLYLSTSLHFYWTMILLVLQSTLVNNYIANICSTYIFNLCFN